MKRMLYLAIGLLAAAACSRQPVLPEEPEPGKVLLTDVTLVAGMPETRTELGISPQLPRWSAGDAIDVVQIGTPEYDEYNYLIVHPFFSGLQGAADLASFHNEEGDAIELGQTYWAACPRGDYDEVGNWIGVEFSGYTDDEYYSYLEFKLPQEQFPTKTSFDPNADLLISKPFTIGADNYDATSHQATVSLEFTRMNAIVKVVLQDKTNGGQGGLLTGQTVRKVVLGYLDTELEGISYAPPVTRVKMEDEEGDYTTLAGDIRVDLGGDGSLEYSIDNYGGNGVVAFYTEDTEYAIGETGAATYLVVNPCILKNEKDDQGVTGLRVLVETEDMIIERYVSLPADGVALQPSRMTTLNIGLFDDGVKNTHIVGKGIGVVQYGEWNDDTEEYEILPVQSLTVGFGENVEVMVKLYGIDPDLVDISDFEFGPQESGVIGLMGDPDFYDGLVQGLRIHGIDLGEATFTVSLEIDGTVYSVSIPVTVTLGENGRSLDGNYGEDNKPGGGISGGNTVIVGGEL